MRAMVQLPSYLDRVLAGGRDLALVLLPLLNDMRAVRGSPLLSEGTLLLLNLKSDQQACAAGAGQRARRAVGRRSGRASCARASRSGLIGWIRGERDRSAPRGAGRRRHAHRADRDHAAGVPAVVGGRRRDRGAARPRPRGQRLDQAPARPRRSRDEAPLRRGRDALRAEPAGRAAEQPALLRRALHRRRSARAGGARARSASASCCRSTRASSRSARTCRRRP